MRALPKQRPPGGPATTDDAKPAQSRENLRTTSPRATGPDLPGPAESRKLSLGGASRQAEGMQMQLRSRFLTAIAFGFGCSVLLGSCSASSGGDSAAGAGGGGAGGAGGSGTGAGGNGGNSGTGGGINLDSGLGGGGGGLTDGQVCNSVSQTADNKLRPVDIIWALDTSDSMVGELQQVEANMNTFANAIVQSGIDVHIVLIAKPGNPTDGSIFNPDPGVCMDPPLGTGACPGGSKPPLYQHVEVSVGSNNALNKLIETYPTYKKTLRQNSVKYFVVLSDDEAKDGPNNSAAAFTQSVNGLDPGWFDEWKVFGIYCTGSCGVFLACAATGNVYKDLVNQTKGVTGDLCGNNQNFSPVFTAMSQAVVSNKTVDCAWDIPPAPAGQTFNPNMVNVNYTAGGTGTAQPIFHVDKAADCTAAGGWYYDDNVSPKKVLVCPATCSAIQADPSALIDVLFGCATVNVPK